MISMADTMPELAQLRESLARCSAFQEDLRSYKLLFPTAT
ncbi:MAG: hypothetical protein QOF42_2928 [Gammaproteobacteria bacterium]|jgi:hypothetical protein|nr:hypothetical protein [Gammaproteobacteria bacterium]